MRPGSQFPTPGGGHRGAIGSKLSLQNTLHNIGDQASSSSMKHNVMSSLSVRRNVHMPRIFPLTGEQELDLPSAGVPIRGYSRTTRLCASMGSPCNYLIWAARSLFPTG